MSDFSFLSFVVHTFVTELRQKILGSGVILWLLVSSFAVETFFDFHLFGGFTEIRLSVMSWSVFVLGKKVFEIDFLFRHVFKYSNSKIIIYSNLTYVSKFIIVALVLSLFYSVDGLSIDFD